jgi:hypothetical protein
MKKYNNRMQPDSDQLALASAANAKRSCADEIKRGVE